MTTALWVLLIAALIIVIWIADKLGLGSAVLVLGGFGLLCLVGRGIRWE